MHGTFKDLPKHLECSHKGVESCTFAIRRSGSIALVGGSGSGKSTIAKMVAGLISVTRGNHRWDASYSIFLGYETHTIARADDFSKSVWGTQSNPYGSSASRTCAPIGCV